jgi:dTDP-glucose 4,6-dehydratase
LIKNYRQESAKKPIFLHFSTDEVYGDISDGAHTEKDLLKPSNPYSATKAAADMLVLAWARTYNLPYVIVRPTNNYGIGQYVEKLIPKTCKFLHLGKKIPLHNNGTPVRNWLHAEDTARAVIRIIEVGVENEIYNIAGGYEQSNYDTVKKVLEEYYGFTLDDKGMAEYLNLEYHRAGQDVRYALDDYKLRTLGWEPRAKFDEELKDIVEYYKNKFIW